MQLRQKLDTSSVSPLHRLAISLACASVIYSGTLSGYAAHAQSATATSPATSTASTEADLGYDAQTIHAFAAAAASILSLRSSYYPRIRAAELAGAQDKANLLFAEMREHMHTAIGQSGFSADQYRSMSSAVKSNTRLHQRISALLKEAPPAKRQVRNVTPVTPPAPNVAVTPRPNEAPAPDAAPITPVRRADTAAPSGNDSARQRLESALASANAAQARSQTQQSALREETEKLERQLSTLKAQDTKLREQLEAEKARASAKQKKAATELQALLGEVSTLKEELETVQSQDSTLREQLESETQRADAEQRSKEEKIAMFRAETKRLAERLSSAQQTLNTMATDLLPGEAEAMRRQAAPFEPLKPLRGEPNSVERLMAKVQPQYALQQELNSEIAQRQKERVQRETERTALQEEIKTLSGELSSAYQAIADLVGDAPTLDIATIDPDLQYETYALDIPQEASQLFEAAPKPFEQALADGPLDIQFDNPILLGVSDPGLEPSPVEPADSISLDPATLTALRVKSPPPVDVAADTAPNDMAADATAEAIFSDVAAETRPIHQIVRSKSELKPAPKPKPAVAPAANPVPSPVLPKEPETASVPLSPPASELQEGTAAYKEANYRRAYDIWSVLANTGNRIAQFHLGALYFEGRGTDIDLAEAYFWLRVSAHQGERRAQKLMQLVAEKLSPEEIADTENRALEWLEQHKTELTQLGGTNNHRLQ